MKKLVALLLALMLCLGVALAEDADIIGTWYLNEVASNGMSFDPATLGLDVTMTFDEDEKATTVSGEETTVSYWRKNGDEYFTPFNDGLLVFAPQDGNLVGEMDGVQMTFGRERAEVEVYDFGEAKTDAAMEDYNGFWDAVEVEMLGMQLPMADVGLTMQMMVQDGTVVISDGNNTGGSEASFEEGVLVIDGMRAQLHESNGEYVLVLPMEVPVEGQMISMKVLFQKFDGDPANFVLPEPFDFGEAQTDATMEDYNGDWYADMVDSQGKQMSMEEWGISMQLCVEDGKVGTITGNDVTWDDATIENGALVAGGTLIQLYKLAGEDVLVMSLEVAPEAGIGMNILFRRIPE